MESIQTDGEWKPRAPVYSLGCLNISRLSFGYGSIPINTMFRGMNIHLPAILMFTRGTRFWHTAICCNLMFCSKSEVETQFESPKQTLECNWTWTNNKSLKQNMDHFVKLRETVRFSYRKSYTKHIINKDDFQNHDMGFVWEYGKSM